MAYVIGNPKTKKAFKELVANGEILSSGLYNPGNRYSLLGVRLVEVIDEQAENLPEKKGSDRPNRGGSCGSGPRHARAVHYFLDTPDTRGWNLGVRLVEMLDEQAACANDDERK